MPELPEVETMRRGVAVVVGSRIEAVEKVRTRRKPILVKPRMPAFRRRAERATITDVARAGKRVVLWLDERDALVIEPRMTGLVLLADPPSRAHLRFRLLLTGGSAEEVLFWDRRGLGTVRLLSRDEFTSRLGPEKLGPDALSLDADALRATLRQSRRAIKVALLDQRVAAGIGNLYASEILHVAGVHPAARCNRLSISQWTAIAEATQEVLREAIHYEGSTLGDGTYRNALNQQGRYQNYHRVYNRAGELCLTCRAAQIERTVQAQRSTFHCPNCQTRSRRRAK